MKRKKLLFLLPVIILLWGLYTVPLRSTGLRFTHIPGDMGDARFNNFVLEHGFRYASGNAPSFWNAPVFYPELNSIAFSDSHLGNLPLYSAFRFLGMDREGAFQGWIIASFILNFASCLYVLRKLNFGWTGASAGAFIFTFGLPAAAKMCHIQLIPRFFVPLVYYRLFKYIMEPGPRHLFYASLFSALQFYVSIYTGWFLVLSGGIFCLAAKLAHKSETPRSPGKGTLRWVSAAAFAVLLLIPLMLPYLGVMAESGRRCWSEIHSMLPRASSLVFPAGNSLLWRGLGDGREFLYPSEHRLFPGALPLAASVFFIMLFFSKKKDEKYKLASACALSVLFVLVVISRMSVRGFNIYRTLTLLPGVGAIRAVTRIMLVLLFPLSVSVCGLFEKIEGAAGKKPGVFLLPLLFIAVLADQAAAPVLPDLENPTGSFRKSRAVARSDSVKNDLLALPELPEVFVYMPAGARSPFWEVHLDAMLAAQSLGIRTINGYSGVFPARYDISMNFGELWALDRWIAHSRRRWEGRERVYPQLKGGDLFEGLVIIGTPRGERSEPGFMEAPLPEDAFRAEITPKKDFIRGIPRGTSRFAVEVRNKSGVNWGSIGRRDGGYEFTLRWRWLSGEGEPLTGFDSLKNIRYDIGPGKSREFNVAVRLPEPRGEYILEFDLFQEQVARFGDMGSDTAFVGAEIR